MLNISSNSSHELENKNQHTEGSLYTAHLQIVLEFSFLFWYKIQISILYSNVAILRHDKSTVTSTGKADTFWYYVNMAD